jgi:hypothetical protein
MERSQAPARAGVRSQPVAASASAPRVVHRSSILVAGSAQESRGGAQARAASVRQTQRNFGNRAAQRVVQRMLAQPAGHVGVGSPGSDTIVVERVSLNPLDWAHDILNSVSGDASAQEAQVKDEAAGHAGDMETRSAVESVRIQGDANAQGAVLQGEAAARGPLIDQQAATQGAALQNQSRTQGAHLQAESSAHAAALAQDANSMSAGLRGSEGALENAARSTEAAADGALTADASGLRSDAEASEGALEAQMCGLEAKATGRVENLSARTRTLVDQKTALVEEYQRPGVHDPEKFHQRWGALQQQIAPLAQEQSSLGGIEDSGEAISERAGTIWANLGKRSEALFSRASDLASNAWSTVQAGWSALQGTAAAAISGLQGKVSGAVNGLKALADTALNGLQGAATQAWTSLKGLADGAWTGLQTRASAAAAALQSQALAAWSSLQGLASSVVGTLGSKISGILSRINGAVGRIVSVIADAVGSLLSRVRSATASALDSLRARASAAWNAVKNIGSRAWEGLKDVGGRAWEGLKSLGTRAWEGLKNAGSRAWEGLKSLGSRVWEGLKSLGQRAWNGLKSAWEWLKKRAQSAWTWLKRAWETIKRKAKQAWDWLKAKAKQAIAWLRKKWAWLKAKVRKAWDWLKAKWRWLKSLVKIRIRIPDQTLCKLHKFKPWKFVDLHSGRLPIAKTVVDPGIGPVELALFVQGDAEATVAGTVGPCTLKNIMFTLQPLISRYMGQADFHVPATATEKLVLTGTIGGTANYGGLIALAGGGLEGTGTANAFGAFEAKPRFMYDSGKITATVPVRFEFCLIPKIDLDAFVVAQLIAGKPPSAAAKPAPFLPGPHPTLPGPGGSPGPLPGLPGPAGPAGPLSVPGPTALPASGASPASASKHEKVLKEWKARWHLGSWSKKECWNLQARFTLLSGPGGLPEVDVDFSARPASIAEVVSKVFTVPPLPITPGGGGGGSGGGGGVTPLGPDPCDKANMDAKIGKRSVKAVVMQSKLGDKMGKKPVKPNQPGVQREVVCEYASRACKGSAFPDIDLYPGKDYLVIDEGHHRFVASRLLDKPVGVSGKHRPPPEPYDPDKENYPNPFEWKEVEWE